MSCNLCLKFRLSLKSKSANNFWQSSEENVYARLVYFIMINWKFSNCLLFQVILCIHTLYSTTSWYEFFYCRATNDILITRPKLWSTVTDRLCMLHASDGQITSHKYKSQIICKNDLNQNLKPKIKSQIIKSNPNHFWPKSNQITNQSYRNVKFLKMFSLHNNYRISQKSQPFCIRQ